MSELDKVREARSEAEAEERLTAWRQSVRVNFVKKVHYLLDQGFITQYLADEALTFNDNIPILSMIQEVYDNVAKIDNGDNFRFCDTIEEIEQ